jgi:hypothetical protein
MAKKVKLLPDEHKKGGQDMNSRSLRRVMLAAALVVACTFAFSVGASAAPAADTKKFEEYRAAIKKAHGIDIKNFKQKLKGGRADAHRVTDFDLDQLIMGIKVEQEHTTDKYTALEISMDHLEEIPDYYTRLEAMEERAEAEWKAKKEAEKRK